MGTKKKRWALLVLVLGLSLLPIACGLGGGGTATTTTAHTSKASTTTSSPAGATGQTEAQKYQTEMSTWVETYWVKADAGALTFKKPKAPTAKEIRRAKDFDAAMHASLDTLRNIGAPAEVATTHAQFYSAYATEVAALDRLIRAIESKNGRDIELAVRSVKEANPVATLAMDALQAYTTQYQKPWASSTGEQGFATFADAKLGFSIQYPKAWKEFPFEQAASGEQLPAKGLAIGDPSGGSFGMLPVNHILFGADAFDAKKYSSPRSELDKDTAQIKTKSLDKFQILEPASEFKLNGLDAVGITFNFVLRGHSLTLRSCYLRSGQTTFQFILCAEDENWQKEKAVFEEIMNSLKVSSST